MEITTTTKEGTMSRINAIVREGNTVTIDYEGRGLVELELVWLESDRPSAVEQVADPHNIPEGMDEADELFRAAVYGADEDDIESARLVGVWRDHETEQTLIRIEGDTPLAGWHVLTHAADSASIELMRDDQVELTRDGLAVELEQARTIDRLGLRNLRAEDGDGPVYGELPANNHLVAVHPDGKAFDLDADGEQFTTVFTLHVHDDGFDLVPGQDVTNRPIGRVFWDHQDPDSQGLVLRLDDAEGDELPDDVDDLARMLARAGYMLDDDSAKELRAFVAECAAETEERA